ncbi:hypothetical protein [Polyangium aurulentum]|uniref:hypothetical protein n=1 Tax=Polyangium aurulentum TaxID=2567896 RepID=UPI0010AE3150|nr:hypothetical protein [Polyangium aurulentum]UQA58807.1 hypothetical protein E8A73_047560 [Polyangium aurulentum]
MSTVALYVTGQAERALGEALGRVFPDIDFQVRPRRDGFTSCPLPEAPILGANRPTNVERLAAALVAEIEPGRRDKPVDMVVLVDDLELCNMSWPERAIAHVRAAVDRHIESFPWPTPQSKDKARERVRERCSFHLLVPMLEAYFFGDPGSLKEAGAVRPSMVDPAVTDVEHFSVQDPELMARPDTPPGAEGPPWARPRRASHPKAYLEFLCDLAGTKKNPYTEENARRALAVLDFPTVLRPPAHVQFLRAMFVDIAERFEREDVITALAGTAHPLTSLGKPNNILRNA